MQYRTKEEMAIAEFVVDPSSQMFLEHLFSIFDIKNLGLEDLYLKYFFDRKYHCSRSARNSLQEHLTLELILLFLEVCRILKKLEFIIAPLGLIRLFMQTIIQLLLNL